MDPYEILDTVVGTPVKLSSMPIMHEKAAQNERLRMNHDLRTTPEDTSQRMLNALQPGTHVPIHRHLKTSETVICLEGCLDWVFYEELPNMDAGGPIHDGETAAENARGQVSGICLN